MLQLLTHREPTLSSVLGDLQLLAHLMSTADSGYNPDEPFCFRGEVIGGRSVFNGRSTNFPPQLVKSQLSTSACFRYQRPIVDGPTGRQCAAKLWEGDEEMYWQVRRLSMAANELVITELMRQVGPRELFGGSRIRLVGDGGGDCGLCWERKSDCYIPECGHCMCRKCAVKWTAKCPWCKVEVKKGVRRLFNCGG